MITDHLWLRTNLRQKFMTAYRLFASQHSFGTKTSMLPMHCRFELWKEA